MQEVASEDANTAGDQARRDNEADGESEEAGTDMSESEIESEYEDFDEIQYTYKEWTATDRAELLTKRCS